MGDIAVGTASWTDKTLLASGWYPEGVDSAAERLAYYASQFRLVEVDSTYYTPPNERNSELWVSRTPPGFTFNVKAFSLMTQPPTRPTALYKDLRPESATKNVYPKDLEPAVIDAVWERFLAALGPLQDAGTSSSRTASTGGPALTMISTRRGRASAAINWSDVSVGMNVPSSPCRSISLFSQMNQATTVVTWKVEDMRSNCYPYNTGAYAVRHNPPPYYATLSATGDNSPAPRATCPTAS